MTDPMPVFEIKAKDRLALEAIGAYVRACENVGLSDQGRETSLAYKEFQEWQRRNPGHMKLPDHKHVPAIDRSEFLVYATGADQLYIRHQPCKTDSTRSSYVDGAWFGRWVAEHVCPEPAPLGSV